jgi:hypothetical protein
MAGSATEQAPTSEETADRPSGERERTERPSGERERIETGEQERVSTEATAPAEAADQPPTDEPASTSPATAALVLPSAVQVTEAATRRLDEEDEEEDRVTDPGPASKPWRTDSLAPRPPDSPNEAEEEGDEEDGRSARATVPRMAAQRAPADANPLRPRKRRAGTDSSGEERAAHRPWIRVRMLTPHNERAAPISHLDQPLFSDEVFVRSGEPRPARPAPAPKPAPASRRWLALVVAGGLALVIAVGWSALTSGPESRSRHRRSAPAETSHEER